MKKNKAFRIEHDSLGEVKVPKKALWGAQTQRAIENFPISGIKFRFPFGRSFIRALGAIKHSAAVANQDLGILTIKKSNAIKSAAKMVMVGEVDDHFPLDVFQTGSGTSTNMNANEVIANIATKKLGADVHPNDDVNMSQSSNDTIPTAICLSTLYDMDEYLLPGLDLLISEIGKKAKSLQGTIKTGRTHLMDAMPIDFSQELSGWLAQLKSCKTSLINANQRMLQLPQGGTAIGTGVNSHRNFPKAFCQALEKTSGFKVKPATNFFQGLSSQDNSAELSSALKNLALVLMKISNDLRWMNSGPLTGLSDIELEALQPGSSIMPGKVNPVIPEMMMQVSAQVIGNDTAITFAAANGNFELNTMLPVMAHNVLESIAILSTSTKVFGEKLIKGLEANTEKLEGNIQKNSILVTALVPKLGYDTAAEVAKEAMSNDKTIKEVLLEKDLLSEAEIDELLDIEKLI